MTDKLINTLRNECSQIDRINPCSPAYKRLIAFLDGLPQDHLKMVRDAKIKFLSRLAINRIVEG
jgi:hypothetical protein